MLTGSDVKGVFRDLLPVELIEKWAEECGVVERERKLQVVQLVYSLVLASSAPGGATLADSLRMYLAEATTEKVVPSAFYKWFTERFATLMDRLATHAHETITRQKPDLPGPLGLASDWHIVDSTTCGLGASFYEEYPGCGEYAALKVHKHLSLGVGAPVHWHFSPAKDHDSPHLTIDETWSGKGLLADLGYASLERLRACIEHDVLVVIRLKENWKPKVDEIRRGEVRGKLMKGADFDALLEDEVLVPDGRAIDARVRLGEDDLPMRLVGVQTPKGYCFYLTNLPAKVGPVQVSQIYRVRWEVELSFKLDKSIHGLAEGVDGTRLENTNALKALLNASLIASTIAALIVHRHLERIPKSGPRGRGKVAPMHANLVAKVLAIGSWKIFEMMTNRRIGTKKAWEAYAAQLVRGAADPNWRSRPSVLDELRGWKRPSKKKRSTKKKTLK